MQGNEATFDPQERRGYRLFTEYGCSSCHQGAGLGGNMYQRFGVMRNYFADRGHETPADLGRFNVTHKEEDRYVFKVPSLRNVALTAPYFHDGSAATLDDAVKIMARYQLGRDVDADDRAALVAFLRTLSGHFEGRPL
jgi:cytochrome c peroxidase